MSQRRRYFTDEFKREAVALMVSSGRPLSRIASELGISASMLRNWRNGSGGDAIAFAKAPQRTPIDAVEGQIGRRLVRNSRRKCSGWLC